MLTAEELLALPLYPVRDDGHPTPTTIEESEVEDDIKEVLSPYVTDEGLQSHPPETITLDRKAHVKFIQKTLSKSLPAGFVVYDATRPWLFYWGFHALTLLGQPIDEYSKVRAVSTILSCQNPHLGGFGGSPGQIPHLMGSYAAINALAIVGSPGPLPSVQEIAQIQSGKQTMQSLGKGGWDSIDRKKLYDWLMRLKQPDGSFTVHEGGEVDVRASYCVWSIASLTGIVTNELLRGMSGFLASCQSYEGGLSSNSYPAYTPELQLDHSIPRPALGEAHGGYAFCATAAYLGLRLTHAHLFPTSASSTQLDGEHHSISSSSKLNLDTLTGWTLGLQCPFPSQGGGYKGRINKLVDGCYSWFSGAGMWGALESVQQLENDAQSTTSPPMDLWSREALQLYILLVAQTPETGGLRDKPGKKSDAYHTCYNLSGLSASQHMVRPCSETRRLCYDSWRKKGGDDGEQELRRRVYASMLGWNLASGREKMVLGSPKNELIPTHPVLNVGFLQVRSMLLWAYGQPE